MKNIISPPWLFSFSGIAESRKRKLNNAVYSEFGTKLALIIVGSNSAERRCHEKNVSALPSRY
jgi:hypothetical protein